MGRRKCDVCSGTTGSVVYDANLPGVGWCWCCHSCFQAHKGKLGIGRGQKYKQVADGTITQEKGGSMPGQSFAQTAYRDGIEPWVEGVNT